MCITLGMTLTTRIMAIEYDEHVLRAAKGWSGPHLLGVSMYVVIFVRWVGWLQLRDHYDCRRGNQSCV